MPHRALASAFALMLILLGHSPLTALSSPSFSARPTAPVQPTTGHGGAEVSYAGVRGGHYGADPAIANPTGYWLFEPTIDAGGSSVAPGPLPLVLLFHGYHGGTSAADAADPADFGSWIDHLVRRGAIVVFPDWEPADARRLVFDHALPDAIVAIEAAVAELGTPGHTTPDLGRVAAVGHSYGAILAAAYAATTQRGEAPAPAVLLLAMPGCAGRVVRACDPFGDLRAIPAATKVLVITGTDEDIFPKDAAWLWERLGSVPTDNKDFITMVSDDHGQPGLRADHSVAVTNNWAELDALDWYGTWKWLDALMVCGFTNDDCQFALGDTPQQRFMGTWSDGVPVSEARVTQEPSVRMP
jgi:acetyl esterase/lipase